MADGGGPDILGMQCVRLIGSGGFADVYLYERDHPRIKVAVKIMKPGALSESQRRQFTAEADTMALLAEHPFIVPVLGAGTSDDGRPYLVMTYYPSSDLAARVAKMPMTVAEALRYGIQLASAVETAHRAGVIHRDIKPSNILLSSYGVMGLSDFGIAGRPTDTNEDDDDDIGISLPWSPREVATGESNGSVQSDVYSLAATVWHLLVGHAPFHVPDGDNTGRATLARIIHENPPALSHPGAPPSLDRLLRQAMAKDPGYRPKSALELARGFQRVEQELRLGRTEIVVLGQSASSSAADLVAPPPTVDPTDAATARAWDTAPATEFKAPRIVAQAPEVRGAPFDAGKTVGKPTRLTSEPTELRPARVSGETPVAITPEDPAPSSRWKLTVGAVVVLVAMIAVGFALSGGNSGASGGATTPPPPDPTLPGITTLPAPTHLRIAGKSATAVTFAWDRVPGATSYLWLDAQGNQTPVPGPRAVVRRTGSTLPCITVEYVKDGQNSAPATTCRS